MHAGRSPRSSEAPQVDAVPDELSYCHRKVKRRRLRCCIALTVYMSVDEAGARRASHLARHLSAAADRPGEEFCFTTAQAEGVLSAQQRQQYERDGFLVVKGLVPRDRLRGWIDHFLDISRSASEGDGMVRGDMTVMKDVAIAKSEAVEGEAAITKLQDWQRDDKLFSYCSQPEVRGELSSRSYALVSPL